MQGIIVEIISNLYTVKVGEKQYEAVPRGKLKQENMTPVVGDHVILEVTEDEKAKAVIEQIMPRKNYCKRPKMANLTQILFVVSLKMPKPDLFLLDKQLAFAEWLGVKSVILLNKIDLEKKEKIKEIASVYQNIGYSVIKTNAKELGCQEKLLEEVKELLRGEVTAFSGNSGVGKSTLINCFVKENTSKEGDISQKSQRGKNTTTAVSLYEMETDTYIADTPGFSTFGIEEIRSNDLDHYFVEWRKEMPHCEYSGCNHIKEENCGVKKAVQEGRIEKCRYEHYVKLYEELKERERREYK